MTIEKQDIPRITEDAKYNAGDTVSLIDTIKLPDESSISTADIQFALSRYEGDDAIIEKSDTDGISIIDAPNGKIRVDIDGPETEGLGYADGRDYYYEIRVRDNTEGTETVTTGTWVIHPSTATFE